MNVYLSDDSGKCVPVVFTGTQVAAQNISNFDRYAGKSRTCNVGKKYVKLNTKGRNLRLGTRRCKNMFEMQCDIAA